MASIYIYLGRHSLLIDLKNGSMMYKAPICAMGTVYHIFLYSSWSVGGREENRMVGACFQFVKQQNTWIFNF